MKCGYEWYGHPGPQPDCHKCGSHYCEWLNFDKEMAKRMNFTISSGDVEVEFDELIENRELAILIRIDDKKYWLPKSQIDFKEWSHFVEIPVWLAEKKGLI